MKSIITKNKIFILTFFLIAYLGYNTLFIEKYNKNTIDTLKLSSDSQIIKLSLSAYENKGQVGKITEMSMHSSLEKGFNSVKNVAYIIECKKDDVDLLNEDITLIYKDNKLIGHKGRYELVREEVVNRETTYNFEVIFNNEGTYDINVYAETYNN